MEETQIQISTHSQFCQQITSPILSPNPHSYPYNSTLTGAYTNGACDPST